MHTYIKEWPCTDVAIYVIKSNKTFKLIIELTIFMITDVATDGSVKLKIDVLTIAYA